MGIEITNEPPLPKNELPPDTMTRLDELANEYDKNLEAWADADAGYVGFRAGWLACEIENSKLWTELEQEILQFKREKARLKEGQLK